MILAVFEILMNYLYSIYSIVLKLFLKDIFLWIFLQTRLLSIKLPVVRHRGDGCQCHSKYNDGRIKCQNVFFFLHLLVGSRLKRLGVPLGLTTVGTAVCYPTQTVGALKVCHFELQSVVIFQFKVNLHWINDHNHFLPNFYHGLIFTVCVQVTGKKIYAASSSVASVFKSKPKEPVITPATSLEVKKFDFHSFHFRPLVRDLLGQGKIVFVQFHRFTPCHM